MLKKEGDDTEVGRIDTIIKVPQVICRIIFLMPYNRTHSQCSRAEKYIEVLLIQDETYTYITHTIRAWNGQHLKVYIYN